MAEVQTNTESGEMAQRFIEFVMMQAQNAALFLGQIPSPHGDGPEINLDLAKLFIDQLVMIRAKTRGNLTEDETKVLNNAISNLQMVFVEVAQQQKSGAAVPEPSAQAAPEPEQVADKPAQETAAEAESKKKFTKSYGA
jgi:hypothetical protein